VIEDRAIDVGNGHFIELITVEPSTVREFLWEHDALPGYSVDRHCISSVDGASWQLLSRDPLTLSPSVHCDPSRGGCGMHGFVTNGHYT
jgi:hypothetical protein